MAEYYPLLARAIAGLPQSTPETRRAIYGRATNALVGQLRAVQPPIAEEDIQREIRLLEEATSRLEREAVAGFLPAGPNAPAAQPAPPAPAPAAEARKTADPVARRTDAPLVRPNAQPPRPALPPRPSLPPRPGATPGERPAGLSGLEAARQRLASLSRPATVKVTAPEKTTDAQQPRMPVETKPTPQQEFRTPATPAPVVRSTPAGTDAPSVDAPKPLPTEAEIAVSRLTGDAAPERREGGAGPISVTLRKYGPRAEAANQSADIHSFDDNSDEPRFGGVRPAAPQPPAEKVRNFRPLLIGLPVALVVGAIAVFAYMRRDNPEDLARLRPAPGAEASNEQSVGKIVERIGGGQTGRPVEQPQTPPQTQTQTQATAPQKNTQQPPVQPNTSAVAVSQRAALLVDAPDEPQRVRTFVGNVVWRLDNVSRGPGQPLAIGVRAEIDMPDAKLKAVVLLQKNTDETLPASHTMEVRFMPTEGGPIPGVAQISTPQMRKEDTPAGDALTGVPAPILRNYFLVGLTRGDAASARNIDLIRTRGWIDIPMLLSDQRIAKITFEKGAAGERVINEALDAWK